MRSGTALVAASGFLLQSIQELGLDPFLGTLRLVDDCPGLVVLPVLGVESEEGSVGIARAAVGAGAGVDGFLVIRNGGILLLFLASACPLAVGVGQAQPAQFWIQRQLLRVLAD